jgi:hypothetical protein
MSKHTSSEIIKCWQNVVEELRKQNVYKEHMYDIDVLGNYLNEKIAMDFISEEKKEENK